MVPDRWFMALVMMPLGLLFFGGGGAWVIAADYSFSDPSVQAGIATGVAANVLMGIIAFLRRPLTEDELQRSRAAYRKVTGGTAILLFATIGIILSIVLTRSSLEPFLISFCFALMAAASILAAVLALAGKGLHQGSSAKTRTIVSTHIQIKKSVPGSDATPRRHPEE